MDRLLEATYRVEQRHFWWIGLRSFVTPLVERAVAGIEHPRILDCGCGTGANLAMLGRYGTAFGFDLSPSGVDYAREYGQRRIANASITHIPFGDATFDLVTAFDVLYSLSEDAEAQSATEMHRVLRPGGRVIVNVAALSNPPRQPFCVRRRGQAIDPTPATACVDAGRLRGGTPHLHEHVAVPADARRPHCPAHDWSRDPRGSRHRRRLTSGADQCRACRAGETRRVDATDFRHADWKFVVGGREEVTNCEVLRAGRSPSMNSGEHRDDGEVRRRRRALRRR